MRSDFSRLACILVETGQGLWVMKIGNIDRVNILNYHRLAITNYQPQICNWLSTTDYGIGIPITI